MHQTETHVPPSREAVRIPISCRNRCRRPVAALTRSVVQEVSQLLASETRDRRGPERITEAPHQPATRPSSENTVSSNPRTIYYNISSPKADRIIGAVSGPRIEPIKDVVVALIKVGSVYVRVAVHSMAAGDHYPEWSCRRGRVDWRRFRACWGRRRGDSCWGVSGIFPAVTVDIV